MIFGGFRTPMRRRFRAAPVIDSGERRKPATGLVTSELPAELEARISALEASKEGPDFDRLSWFWMILFGIALPLILIVLGWWI